MIKQWLMFGLAVGVFASCSQEGNEPNSTAEVGGEIVSFSLSAEVSVDDPSLRAIDYKLGNNANGELVPMPQFTDKQEVEVHTILKSSNGEVAAKTLKWRYDAEKRKLVLRQNDGHSIDVWDFNNDNDTKWYISALIGGALNGTQVEFMGSRVVKGVDGNAGDALGSMDVPYAFGWTELTISTSSPKDSKDSHKYAEVPASKNVKFQPLGSMLAVKLGSNQSAGAYTFTPKGFTLSSNAWGDQGSFELSTDIPPTDPHTALPTWTEGSCAGSMYYTFASGEEPGAIAHNQTTAKTYYVWVMPHNTLPTTADVRVMFKGTSSRPETETYKDYTNTWFTDYTTEGKATQGKVTQGRVHPLTAKATHRVALPIEYVTEYNLAGGEGLTYTVAPGTARGRLNSPELGGVQPAGMTGPLRFASSHNNDQSGYYNWYKVAGLHHVNYNPDKRNLQLEIDNTFGADNYHIPEQDEWWGIYPSGLPLAVSWDGRRGQPYGGAFEEVSVASFRQYYRSHYSGVSSGNGTTNVPTFYAIRFQKLDYCVQGREGRMNGLLDFEDGNHGYLYYPTALDNSMKCAYRFRLIGGQPSWLIYNNQNLTNQLVVDVVYLGEEAIATELSAVSSEVWWSSKQAEGKVLSRVFPAPGYMYGTGMSATLANRGSWSTYYSSSLRVNAGEYTPASAWIVDCTGSLITSSGGSYIYDALPIRLFKSKHKND